MDINKILAVVRLENEQPGQAIVSIERLAARGAKSRLKEERASGRPAGSKNRGSIKRWC